ncbi:hypothetical protein N2603_38930 [Bradyrhizobium huanghuaihaiense]|uniref:hypothetical protein n=1 Tax=Bradyrhizobium huanghuaihaiense TaxID=990078 RepID=UPI0021AA94C1|nr:hypothetical protein [Bradyrhizobium sp. CB3035]UWU75864.1 hypothetical protein N2603_38930 [Bradyrhizobium sp. CB3035]
MSVTVPHNGVLRWSALFGACFGEVIENGQRDQARLGNEQSHTFKPPAPRYLGMSRVLLNF